MSNAVKYINAHIIDALGSYNGCVYTEGGRITYVGQTDPKLTCSRTIDVQGHALMPAFIDMHTHLRDPGYTYKETLESGMKAALKGGYATLCAMANTFPVCATVEQVEHNHKRARELKLCRLYQCAAAGLDLKDETPTDRQALSRVTPILTNDGLTIFNDDFMRQLLMDSASYGFIISTHCQPERKTVARDIALLNQVGGNLHIGHISRAETVSMVAKAKAEGLKLSCEVTPHHLFAHDCDYRVNPPLRTAADVAALIQGIKDGVIDCLATDHAPHSEEDKAQGMAGIANIEHAAQIFMKVFYDNGIPLTTLSRMSSYNPAKLLRLEAGLIREGFIADIALVDAQAHEKIDKTNMVSLSRNTPFHGREVRGRVLATIVGGEIRYDNGFIG